MKKNKALKIIIPALVLAAALICLLADFNRYSPGTKTIASGGDLILSVTAYDGKTETKPFVKCLGHAWLSVDNNTGHSVYLKDYEIKDGEIITFGIWATSGHRGVFYNLEAGFIKQNGRYWGRKSIGIGINEQDLKKIEEFISANDNWTAGRNCSHWAIDLWNYVVDPDYSLKTQTLLYTPKRLQRSLCEYACVQTDMDFSRAEGIFYYRDNVRTELLLCE